MQSDMVEEADPPLPHEPLPVVFVDNLSEDVWPFIAALENEAARQAEVTENVGLSDRQYLGIRAEFPRGLYFVGPGQIDPAFIQYVDSLVDGVEPHILVPKHHSGLLSNDILEDKQVLNDLLSVGRMRLISYCSSQPFYKLVDSLDGQKQVTLVTPEAPPKDRWQQTVGVYGTKTGLREALDAKNGTLPGIKMAKGLVVQSKNNIIKEALRFNGAGDGVVIKTQKGHSGMGVLIIRPGELIGSTEAQQTQLRTLLEESNGYWDLFPAVVEAYIPTNRDIGGGFPNVECRVNEDGKTEVLFECGMRVNRGGIFAGMELDQAALPLKYEKRVREIGSELGALYAADGYRGYFDVDFLAGTDGELYVGESNVRRTGGTWAYHLARRLFGDHYLAGGRYFASNLLKIDPAISVTFDELLALFKSILFDRNQGRETGVIIASANLLRQNTLNYMVVAKNRTEAAMYEKEILRLLETTRQPNLL